LSKISTKAEIVFYGASSDDYNKLDFDLAIPGKHNVLNALSIVALADHLGIDRKIVAATLETFAGAHRRFEYLGVYNGAQLIDDYGHHPTEIAVTLAALAERYPDKKKVVVFWPHQYKRILPLIKEFARSFTAADEVIIKPIFFVPGRDEILPVTSEDLVDEINNVKKNAQYFGTDEEIVEYLKNNLNENSVLLTIGIPPVYQIILKLLEAKE
jgi:UDP-N-acetylmuramate--alanine ligase